MLACCSRSMNGQVFVHVPKTGGSTIRDQLKACAKSNGMEYAYGHNTNFLELPPEEQKKYMVVHAHMGYGIHIQAGFPEYRRKCTHYLTVTDTVAHRAWSQYKFFNDNRCGWSWSQAAPACGSADLRPAHTCRSFAPGAQVQATAVCFLVHMHELRHPYMHGGPHGWRECGGARAQGWLAQRITHPRAADRYCLCRTLHGGCSSWLTTTTTTTTTTTIATRQRQRQRRR